MIKWRFFIAAIAFSSCQSSDNVVDTTAKITGIEKVEDIVIYQDSLYYSAFPSVIKMDNNKFLLSFRRAPNRLLYGEENYTHVDNNSYLVGMESLDGKNWEAPKLIYAHDFGGSQDPCLIKLNSGKILCASYGWTQLRTNKPLKEPAFISGGFTFQGGYYVSSEDNANTWSTVQYPISIEQESKYTAFGDKVTAYNRGSMYQGSNNDVYWVVASGNAKGNSENNLIVSSDDGKSWKQMGVVAESNSISFNEASVYETPKGDIVSFIRTANYGDTAVISRSTDGGKTFNWKSMGFKGHPMQALRLPDNQVLIVYGYRHKPYGIRARILDEECMNFETAKEFIIREDGGSTDIGYPWAVLLNDNEVLVSYYFNHDEGLRYIAGSVLSLKR